MAVWVIRGGSYEEEALEDGKTSIDYDISKDLKDAQTRDDVRNLVHQVLPHVDNKRIGQITGQLWNFKSSIDNGDLIVMPRKGQPTIAIGEMAGDYVYLTDRPEHFHMRRVTWINKEVARNSLDLDLKGSISSIVTVFRPKAEDAEERLRAIAKGLHLPIGHEVNGSGDGEEVGLSVNLEEEASNRIRDYIGVQFHSHDFTRLVAAVLQAQGYAVEVAPPGPDGGVDIVAGSGSMGFDPPRICVQVKSGIQTTGASVLRELKGTLNSFGADYGLLVSWGGFTGEAQREGRKSSYFNVRLWASEAFLKVLFENYDRLPASLKAELPLQQVWLLDQPPV